MTCTYVVSVYQGVRMRCGQPGKRTGERRQPFEMTIIRCADHWPKVVG